MVITAEHEGIPVGPAATWFRSLGLKPAPISLSLSF